MPVEVRIPSVGESITEVTLGQWVKSEGDEVERDETLIELESEKATFDLPAPTAGQVKQLLVPSGSVAKVGQVVAYIDEAAAPAKGKSAPKPTPDKAAEKPGKSEPAEPRVMPAAQRLLAQKGLSATEVATSGPGGRLLKEDVERHAAKPAAADLRLGGDREEEVVPMTPLRKRIASRLVEAQQQAALLTTFNECDMTAVMELRNRHKEAYEKRYGIKLGFMSFFVKAVVDGLKAIPQVNAEVRGTDIVYRNYYDIGIAVGGGKGLVVPVLRNTERMSFSEIELKIAEYGKRAKENALKPDELTGGTFTISNGGVYGSLLSTPIVNAPQSGILGMHAIQDRPIALSGQVVIRPMMYLAFTYDHRIVDGREAVTFLKRIKDCIEEPTRMLLEV